MPEILAKLVGWEERLVDQRAQEMFEEDAPPWLSWDELSHDIKEEYRAIARREAQGVN